MRNRMQILRRPTHRFSAEDFRNLVTSADALDEREAREPHGLHSGIVALREWARGGLDYAEGRTAAATDTRAALASATAPWFVAWSAAVFGDGGAWSLSAFYADSRRELEKDLQPLLPGIGGTPRAALAAAWLAHLEGNHAGAVKLLLDAGIDPRRARGGDARGRALTAQLLALESAESADQASADQFLPLGLEEGHAPFARPFLIEMVSAAHDHLGQVATEALIARGCGLGIEQLCKKEEGGSTLPAERTFGRGTRRRGLRGGYVPPGPGGRR
jgi:hypothetical protein